MKILAIRGKNIASLEDEFEIDFTTEPLKSNGIFAITGSTGSGKSTILDVLCLALYNDTPRLKAAKGKYIEDYANQPIPDNNSKTLLRKGSASGYAEVDFLAVTGETYRASLQIKRAHGRIDGAIQTPKLTLENLTKNTPEPGRATELQARIEQLVGLTYEQFSRSVLLAQGEFSAFLKTDDKQRANLLEKLTGTAIYSQISAKVFELASASEKRLEQIRSKMNDYKLLTTEELDALEEELKKDADAMMKLDREIEQTNRQIEWFDTEA